MRPFDKGPAEALAARLPSLLRAFRGAEGDRGRNPEPPLGPAELERVGAALLRLQRGLTSERELAGREGGKGYMDAPELLGAYLLYYWPVSYLETFLSLSFLPLRAERVLDLGSGPGPAAAAFADALGAEELLLADGSGPALELAAELLGPAAGARLLVADLQDGELPELGSFDALVASHLLNELWKREPDRIERRLAFLRARAKLLRPEGFLLAIEPATLAASRDLLSLRDGLAAEGWRILAPCPSSAPCPILGAGEGRSCHDEVAWEPPEPLASLARVAGLDRSALKWSFFVARPPRGEWAPAPQGREAAAPVARAGGPLPSGGSPFEGAREGRPTGPGDLVGVVVSEGLLNKAGRLRYALCTDSGLRSLSAKAGALPPGTGGFAGLRRYDRVEVGGAEAREGGLGLVEGSSLRVEPAPGLGAPAPKGRPPGSLQKGRRR